MSMTQVFGKVDMDGEVMPTWANNEETEHTFFTACLIEHPPPVFCKVLHRRDILFVSHDLRGHFKKEMTTWSTNPTIHQRTFNALPPFRGVTHPTMTGCKGLDTDRVPAEVPTEYFLTYRVSDDGKKTSACEAFQSLREVF